jgi:hypothetical protein
VRDDDGLVVESYHVMHDEDPYSARHYYSRDFMGNIVESVVTENGEHVETILHDKDMKSVIEKINEKNGSIRVFSAAGQKLCGMLRDEEQSDHLNHFDISICEYDFRGNWVIRIGSYLIGMPKYFREHHGWTQEYFIEIRDIEYEDFLDDMPFSMLDFQ